VEELTTRYVEAKLEQYGPRRVPLSDVVLRFRDQLLRVPSDEQANKLDLAILDDLIHRLHPLRGSAAATTQSDPVKDNTSV
jgi:hypothetical protein